MKLKDIDNGISGIYKIIFDNDKVYIGLSNDIHRRIIEHLNRDLKNYPELLVCQAIMTHTIKDIEIIEYIDGRDRQKLIEREIYWIAYYHSYEDRSKGYNMTPGEDGAAAGIYNNASYISQEQLDLIFDLLLNSNKTYNEITELTGSSYSIISHINSGLHYYNFNLAYPLREKRLERYELENKHSAFYGRENELFNLIQDLKDNVLTYKELKNKYNIQETTLSIINQGKKYKQNNETYPLRPVDKGTTRRIFTNEELEKIKKLLESSVSMKDIAKELCCDSKVIAAINKGERQPNADWSYPLRKTPLKTGPKSKYI